VKCGKDFVELDKSIHDRRSFDCGKEELNTFLQTRASNHMDANVSKTFLLASPDTISNGMNAICAFYTITGATTARADLPHELAKKLPTYPIPVFVLGQLAVHRECARTGLGKIALVDALHRFFEINKHMPSYAVIVDCIDNDAEGFYQKYGFAELNRINGRARMFMPISTISQLFRDDQ